MTQATTRRARAAVDAAVEGADPNKAIAVADGKDVEQQAKPTVASFIKNLQPEIARALPRGMDADRIARLALTVVRQSMREKAKGNAKESLADCSPESFAGALLTSSALGLEPGVNGECYLVPYKGECTLIVGYQGYAKLFYQHPLAKNLDARAVYEADEFDYGYGTSPFLKHKPALGPDRGKVVAYYAVANLSSGASAFVVLSPDEVKELRNGLVGTKGQIKDPQRWMERKTALRQLVKLLPKSANLSAALAVDEQPGSVLANRKVAAAIVDDDAIPELPPAADNDEAPANVDTVTGEVIEPTDEEIAAMAAEMAGDE
jgi:recombination protein RecT